MRIGRVGRPHGRDGGFTVSEPTERPELLTPGRVVWVEGRALTVAARRGTPGRPIVVLAEITDRAGAEALRGADLCVPRASLPALAEGEFLVDDLVGCMVADGERDVGRVRDVLLLPSADALEVEREGRDPVLVPLVRDAVRSVDTARRRIEVDMTFVEGPG